MSAGRDLVRVLDRALVVRLAVVVLAAAAVAAALPAWVRTPLSLAAALAVLGAVLHRRDDRGRVHGLTLAVGGGLVLLALLGLLLVVTPWGLTRAAWGVGAGLVEVVALLALALRRPRRTGAARAPEERRRLPLAAAGWSLGVVAVTAAAVVVSLLSFGATHVAPLALGMVRSGSGWDVTATSGATAGPYELDVVTASGRRVLAHGLVVGPGRDATVRVPTPAERALVLLVPDGGGAPVRQLIIAGSGS